MWVILKTLFVGWVGQDCFGLLRWTIDSGQFCSPSDSPTHFARLSFEEQAHCAIRKAESLKPRICSISALIIFVSIQTFANFLDNIYMEGICFVPLCFYLLTDTNKELYGQSSTHTIQICSLNDP
ncbi:unnamed protein product, partial [Vitis vinifera]